MLDPYSSCIATDRRVLVIDPFSMDDFFFYDLPDLNHKSDPIKIWEIAKSCIQRIDISSLNREQSMAAIRDLGMIASSLRRHNFPLTKTPELELALLNLSKSTKEVPADSVTSYGPRNPEGRRMRVFTSFEEERFFIASFRSGMIDLPLSIRALEINQGLSVFDAQFSENLKIAKLHFDNMVSAIIGVRRQISPSFFTSELRPYFEPKVIGGKKYLAPGGAQMPIILIDQILWGISTNDSLSKYFFENLSYQPLLLRVRAENTRKKQVLVEKVIIAMKNVDASTQKRDIATVAARTLREMLLTLEKFRNIHLRIAQDNMAIRIPGSVGSGGYDTKILETLLSSTKVARQRIEDVLTKST